MPNTDLRSRLQRLRPRQGPASRPPEANHTPRELTYETLPEMVLPGVEQHTPYGAFQLIEERYPLTHQHGHLTFDALLAHQAETVAKLARTPQFAAADLRGLAFIDTETTGLAGGAGTLAFLVGVGMFDEQAGGFVLRQYFLRQPDEEPAMLQQLLRDLSPRTGWVTFNGRAFDLPILENRLTLNRQPSAVLQRPHLDLLPPARLLYRGRLASCALSSLEKHVLGVPRSADDVPGEMIPWMYVNYLRTGDAREMRRVIYHNAVDIFSMVTLAAHLLEVFSTTVDGAALRATDDGRRRTAEPRAVAHRPSSSVHKPLAPADLLRLALWHDREARLAEAEAAYRQALAGRLELADRQAALMRLAALLKRLNRRAEAVPLWEQWASFTVDDALPCLELAKFYEWKLGDMAQALDWARRAERIIKGMPSGWRKAEAQAAIERRLERLRRKHSGEED